MTIQADDLTVQYGRNTIIDAMSFAPLDGGKVVGLLGPRVDGDAIRRWNNLLRQGGADRVAVPLVVPDDTSAPDVLASLHALDLTALVVAPELQEVVGQALDGLQSSACRVGRVNLIEYQAGTLSGAWIDRDDELPNGRELGREWIAQLRALTG